MNYDNLNRYKVCYVSRKIDSKRVAEIKNKYGKSVFITCGKSANIENINIINYDGCIFTTTGINITSDGNVVKLPTEILDTQNYIAASNIVIAKAGWATFQNL